jgi:hypothetical protein
MNYPFEKKSDKFYRIYGKKFAEQYLHSHGMYSSQRLPIFLKPVELGSFCTHSRVKKLQKKRADIEIAKHFNNLNLNDENNNDTSTLDNNFSDFKYLGKIKIWKKEFTVLLFSFI